MARRDTFCVYDQIHNLQVCNKNGFLENRNVNINITDFTEYLQVKVRDAADFVFNYTINIDTRQFEIMRNEQSLDIDFGEFKTDLIDMLRQVNKQDMFLKCEIDGYICKLIFFGKSKIKSIIFLTVDLQVTNQKEVFDEMNCSLLELQKINKNLSSQLHATKKRLQDKDFEAKNWHSINQQLKKRFVEDLQNVSYVFSTRLQECSAKLLGKILGLTQRLLKLTQDVEIVKAEALLKSDSSARLLQTMENLRLESIEASNIISELRKENCGLRSAQYNDERVVAELHKTIADTKKDYNELKKEKEEIEKDVKQATVIIAQKTAANEELAKDLVQANQMLVNFNHLYDTKNKELEDLQNSLAAKDKIVQDLNHRYHELYREFEDYRSKFNAEGQNRLSHELFAAQKRIEEAEKLNRDTVKLNELLTRKLASGDFLQKHFNH